MTQDRRRSRAKPPQPPLVAFDFDGTITTRDSFTAFLRWRAGPVRYALGLLRLLPGVIGYLFHRDRGRIKAQAVAEFLRGVPREDLEADAVRVRVLHVAPVAEPSIGCREPSAIST